ncbi:hypothetical protein [Methanosphaerula subterraneus]|uniref:hypothetical protein n=1 Tax=Methanosphaerula subterraneus TaxID=3350244 RepID=UPI003F831A66
MTLNDAQQIFGFFFAIYFFMIVERSHQTYKPWDTYQAIHGKIHNINRLVLAWIVLMILPVTQFAILFTLLGLFEVPFDATITGVFRIILISISSFFTFGYFRIYESFLHRSPEMFFPEEELKEPAFELRPDFWAHFIPGALYLIIPTLLLFTALYI